MASPKIHATLSASSAHRWLSAPPLPQLEKYFPKDASPMAAEGTAAHALGNTNSVRPWDTRLNDRRQILIMTTWKLILTTTVLM